MTIKDNPIDTTIDEETLQEEFTSAVGGVKKADRLQYIWNNCCPHSTNNMFRPITKEDDFRRQAKAEGYTDKQIDMFLKLWEV